jgi:hypothetical protein
MLKVKNEFDFAEKDAADAQAALADFVMPSPQLSAAETKKRNDAALLEDKTKFPWRAAMVARVDARLKILAESKGISHVSDELATFLEDALHCRVKKLTEMAQRFGRERCDINKSAFTPFVTAEPKKGVREINMRIEAANLAREERKRQLLLSRATGQKRKARELAVEVVDACKDDVERVLKQAANKAARNALGVNPKELKWANTAPIENANVGYERRQTSFKQTLSRFADQAGAEPSLVKSDFERAHKM